MRILNIIFLDIDGVLNTERYIIEQYEKNGNTKFHHMDYNFDPICMKNIKELIEKTDANVVISSTWRVHKKWQKTDGSWNAILDNFNKYGIDIGRIIDITPILHTERGNEIRMWLHGNQHLGIDNFVVLDDDSDMCEFTDTHLAKCSWKNGLTEEAKNKALQILKYI